MVSLPSLLDPPRHAALSAMAAMAPTRIRVIVLFTLLFTFLCTVSPMIVVIAGSHRGHRASTLVQTIEPQGIRSQYRVALGRRPALEIIPDHLHHARVVSRRRAHRPVQIGRAHV